MKSRKIILNLTPMMDLLLILLFFYQAKNLLALHDVDGKRIDQEKRNEYQIKTIEKLQSNEVELNKIISDKDAEINKLKDDNRILSENKAIMNDLINGMGSNLGKLYKNIDKSKLKDIVESKSLSKSDLEKISLFLNSLKSKNEQEIVNEIIKDAAIKKVITFYYVKIKGDPNVEISISTDEKEDKYEILPITSEESIQNYVIEHLLSETQRSNDMKFIYYQWEGSCSWDNRDILKKHLLRVTNNTNVKFAAGGLINAK